MFTIVVSILSFFRGFDYTSAIIWSGDYTEIVVVLSFLRIAQAAKLFFQSRVNPPSFDCLYILFILSSYVFLSLLPSQYFFWNWEVGNRLFRHYLWYNVPSQTPQSLFNTSATISCNLPFSLARAGYWRRFRELWQICVLEGSACFCIVQVCACLWWNGISFCRGKSICVQNTSLIDFGRKKGRPSTWFSTLVSNFYAKIGTTSDSTSLVLWPPPWHLLTPHLARRSSWELQVSFWAISSFNTHQINWCLLFSFYLNVINGGNSMSICDTICYKWDIIFGRII